MARRTRWLTSETRRWTLAISGATLLVVAAGTTVDKWVLVSEFLDRREAALQQRPEELSRKLDEAFPSSAAQGWESAVRS